MADKDGWLKKILGNKDDLGYQPLQNQDGGAAFDGSASRPRAIKAGVTHAITAEIVVQEAKWPEQDRVFESTPQFAPALSTLRQNLAHFIVREMRDERLPANHEEQIEYVMQNATKIRESFDTFYDIGKNVIASHNTGVVPKHKDEKIDTNDRFRENVAAVLQTIQDLKEQRSSSTGYFQYNRQ